MKLRSQLYRIARLLGDLEALRKGPRAFLARQVRKSLIKATNKRINRIR